MLMKNKTMLRLISIVCLFVFKFLKFKVSYNYITLVKNYSRVILSNDFYKILTTYFFKAKTLVSLHFTVFMLKFYGFFEILNLDLICFQWFLVFEKIEKISDLG